MNTIKKIVLGDSTEAIIKSIFNNRIAQESREETLNSISRASQIKDLQIQVLSFIKRNANSSFKLKFEEYNVNKQLVLNFTNFQEIDFSEDDETSKFELEIDNSFTKCYVSQKADLGKDITLTIVSK